MVDREAQAPWLLVTVTSGSEAHATCAFAAGDDHALDSTADLQRIGVLS
jgi:hypothetical protein